MSASKKIAFSAAIGAFYAALTLALAPIGFGPVQFRVSEALTVLPFIFPAATPGLFVGCLISNIIGSGNILDIVFGPLATLAAGLLTAKCRSKFLAPLPPVVINAVVIGLVLGYTSAPESFLLPSLVIGGQIFVSQTVACYGLGLPLVHFLEKRKVSLSKRPD